MPVPNHTAAPTRFAGCQFYARPVLAVSLAAMLLLFLTRAEAQTATAMVTSPDGVNLRAGPGTAYPVLAVLPFGTTVTVTGAPTADNWVPVVYQELTGYILGDYLALQASVVGGTGGPGPGAAPRTPTPTPISTASVPVQAMAAPTPASTPLPTPTPAGGDGQTATVVPPDGLNLRAGPGTGFPVVVTMPGGARVQVIGRPTADGWYPVRYADKVGWADGAYLAFGRAAPTPAASAGVGAGASRFIWPVQGRRITTRFSATHPGIDIDQFPDGGNPVVAAAAGTVTFAGGDPCCSYGLYVIVKHADGYSTLYAHLASIAVSVGQVVAQGTVLGRSGNTGFSTGAHLHFEIRKDDVPVDPLSLLPGPWEE